ncbi:PEP-CTERM sorting domain-containing protein [Aphanothece sacrum]|uniref:Flagellar hook-length control protein FliK n=1 Tax=Aphanothece sacrum FPU1 TaxID=1920663 RepID=A0A401IHH6_APHSA|nr:PEP-CTERM sorting domain-containing protein [Aphanothece sacrum]GBF80601.1 flagellar hook-length control protein FliK [Aphanothece sacrum FPU1]GBF84009.1 flagellar hook-length control protein FliK [Aphanothece sacrum FPU3]
MQITKSLTTLSLVTFGGAVFSLMSADVAQAVTFIFNADDSNLSTIVKTVDGITLTISNNQTRGSFFVDLDGISVLAGTPFSGTKTTSFDLTFSSAVQLTSYTIGYIENLDGDESLILSNGSSSSVENAPFTTGLRNFNNQFKVAAGQTISFIGNFGADVSDIIQWSAIEVTPVSVPVPVPVTIPEPSSMLGLLVLGGLGINSNLKKLKK